MATAAIIQARMGSTRLPGKSLAKLGDLTVLDWVTRRARRAELVDEVIVATSDGLDDDRIAQHCRETNVHCVRGDALDVLQRYHSAMQHTDADVIVRLTADCPFIDPSVVDQVIRTLAAERRGNPTDYVSTSLDGRYPRGLDTEAMRRPALETAHQESTDPAEREHVTLFIYRRPERFVCRPASAPTWARRPDLRFTVDQQEDLELVRQVVRLSEADEATLSGERIISLLDRHPEIASVNATVPHRDVS